MIFVTVGLHKNGFNRLIKKMDVISGKIEEEVVMQIGFTEYEPKNSDYFRFVDDDEKILAYFRKARIIVSHAGAGTIINAFSLRKPIVVVPRIRNFGEHIDNQQFDLAKVLSENNQLIVAYDLGNLEDILMKPISIKYSTASGKFGLAQFLYNYIEDLRK